MQGYIVFVMFNSVIAIELCNTSLDKYFTKTKEEYERWMPYFLDSLVQLADGLAYIHEQTSIDGEKKLIHRDIAPSNILIKVNRDESRSTAVLKWADFGLTKWINEESSVTHVTARAQWVAPELQKYSGAKSEDIPSDVKASAASDVFSAGCVFYYVATEGKHPFDGGSKSKLENILDKDYVPMSECHDCEYLFIFRKRILAARCIVTWLQFQVLFVLAILIINHFRKKILSALMAFATSLAK